MKSMFYPDMDQNENVKGNKVQNNDKASDDVMVDEIIKQHKPQEKDKDVVEYLIQEGQPMRMTNWFVDKPCTVMGVGFFVLIVISILAVTLGYFEQTEQHRREYLIWDDQMTKNYDM